MSSKRPFAGWCLTALTLSLVACGTAAPAEPPGIAKQPETGPPQHGGTLQLATRTPPNNLHPHSDTSLGNTITSTPVYETLLKYDYSGDFRDEYKLLPWLAERWERTDPVTYVFHLRKGVKFHPSAGSGQAGDEMTADDVAWSLDWFRDPANKFRNAGQVRDIDKIQVVDPYTVRITSKEPSPTFIGKITERNPVVVSKRAFDRGVNLEREMVGTGPFKLSAWDRTAGATLVKHGDYWSQGRPYLDKVQLFYNLEAAASIAAFAARKNDVVKVADKVQFDGIAAASPDARGESFPQDISDHLVMRLDRPPFNDIRVRRALHLALDRQEMASTITFGLGNPNPPAINGARKGGWSIAQEELGKLPGYRQPKEQDLAEAKRLLAEAGHGAGLRTTFLFNSGHTRHPAEAQVVASQAPKAGFNLTLDPKEISVALKAEEEGDFIMTFANFRFEADGTDWPFWLHSSQARARTGLNDPELDRLIDGQAVELDETKRKGMWIQIQRLLLDKLYVIPLITQVGFIAYQPYVFGWGDNRAGQAVNLSWENTWMDQSKVPSGR